MLKGRIAKLTREIKAFNPDKLSLMDTETEKDRLEADISKLDKILTLFANKIQFQYWSHQGNSTKDFC